MMNVKTDKKEIVKSQLLTYLSDKGIDVKKNFRCLNPLHEDKHPSMSYDEKRNCVHCFSCGVNYDIFNIIAIDYNLTDHKEIFKKAYDIFNLNHDGEESKTKQDYVLFYKEAHKHINETDYIARRGISVDVAERFMLGYVNDWRHPKAPQNVPVSPRIIIPTSENSYLARDTRLNLSDEQKKYSKSKVGKVKIFNSEALQTAQKPIFIVEGEIDALSIIEVGGEAIAIGSTSNKRALLTLLSTNKPVQPLIIAMDNDSAGDIASTELSEGLQQLNVSWYRYNPYGAFKDANEALLSDREVFKSEVMNAEYKAVAENQKPTANAKNANDNIAVHGVLPATVGNEQKSSRDVKITADNPIPHAMDKYIDDIFTDDIEKFKKFKNRETGFKNLDEQCGGLYPGLYAVGAISSLGKTTFIQQIGDQLAQAGEHVLFFSLEQSRFELVTKSISRITAQTNINKAASAINIRRGEITSEVVKAAEKYKEFAGNISIIECNFDTNIHFILNYVKEYIKVNGVKPVVIVDYLQIIPPADQHQSEKEKIDSMIRGLKKLQSENDLVVFIVSSINRANYLAPIDFESFKESGGIEYTCDVIWGLQLQAINGIIFNKDHNIKKKREIIRNAKKAIPRKIELICLKNRYGISSYSCGFYYNPVYDLFIPDEMYNCHVEFDDREFNSSESHGDINNKVKII